MLVLTCEKVVVSGLGIVGRDFKLTLALANCDGGALFCSMSKAVITAHYHGLLPNFP